MNFMDINNVEHLNAGIHNKHKKEHIYFWKMCFLVFYLVVFQLFDASLICID